LWFKPTAGLVVLGLLVWAVWHAQRAHWPVADHLRAGVLLVCGGLAGLFPIGLYLYGHGLKELLEIWHTYGTGAYLGSRGLALGSGLLATLDVFMAYMREWQLLVWLTLAGLVAICLHRNRDSTETTPWGGVVIAFLLSSLAMVLVQGKLFEYHWIPALAPAAILSSVSLVWLGDEWRNRLSARQRAAMGSLLAVIGIAGLLLGIGYDRLAEYRRLAAYLSGRISAGQYDAQFTIGQDYSHTGAVAAAVYLREHTQPGETALIWGAEPLVNFLAERRSPSKYIFSYMLVNESGDPRLAPLREDLLRELRMNPPAYAVLVQNDAHPLSPGGSRAELLAFPELARWLELHYQFEQQVEDYLFYRRG
jgi:hypothetical protein